MSAIWRASREEVLMMMMVVMKKKNPNGKIAYNAFVHRTHEFYGK